MTRTLQFEKLHGAGNDFVFIEDLKDEFDFSAEDVARLCDRHFGIGADGVIVVKPPQNPENDGFMHYINSDGSLAQMCGNGVRCFAKYLVDHQIGNLQNRELKVETRSGVKNISYKCDNNNKLTSARVDMGEPILEPALLPTTLKANAQDNSGRDFVKDALIESPYGSFKFTCVSMGNPHAVTFVDDCDTLDIERIGSYFESHEAFPEKANIEFATIKNDGVHMRVYERGCGETLACGTGACATSVAAFLTGRTGLSNTLILRGGILEIEYQENAHIFMTGPATFSYKGEISL